MADQNVVVVESPAKAKTINKYLGPDYTVIASYASKPGEVRLFEVTPEKKIVWKYQSSDRPGIHHFHILDTNGRPLEGIPLR